MNTKRASLVVAAMLVSVLAAGCQQYTGPGQCDPDLGAEKYLCPDGSQVPWCTCQEGQWDCQPEPQQQCQDIPSCTSDADCTPATYCDSCATSSCPGCDDCLPGCLNHGCPSEDQPTCRALRPDCGPGGVAVVASGCWVCVDRQTCQPLEQRDTSCDDGSELTCADAQPQCADWEIPAIIDGCWLCVNPESCRPWSEPGCLSDAGCEPSERCDDCARGSCPDCEDCVADCLPHGCPTEKQPDCKMPRPACEPGQVAVVTDGCWVCVELGTCQPPRDTSCDDGSEVLCDMIPPKCQEHEILAAQNGCWACVNPVSCRPWGEAGCATDGDCGPDAYCDPCGTSSCPMCDDCLAACLPHYCPTEDQLLCNCVRPKCSDGAVTVIQDGCWVCVTRVTCQPTGEGC